MLECESEKWCDTHVTGGWVWQENVIGHGEGTEWERIITPREHLHAPVLQCSLPRVTSTACWSQRVHSYSRISSPQRKRWSSRIPGGSSHFRTPAHFWDTGRRGFCVPDSNSNPGFGFGIQCWNIAPVESWRVIRSLKPEAHIPDLRDLCWRNLKK